MGEKDVGVRTICGKQMRSSEEEEQGAHKMARGWAPRHSRPGHEPNIWCEVVLQN